MKISIKKRMAVYAKTSGFCSYCGTPISLDDFAIDHVHPRFHGGKNNIDNLAPCCFACNSSKGVKSIEEFRLFVSVKNVTGCALFSLKQIVYLKDAGAFPVLGFNDNYRFYFEITGEVAA